MYIPFREPVSPRYIHINPKTNQVHLLVPIVGGQEISTDNTCQATVALKDFFEGRALRELTAYKKALVFDITLLEEGNPQRTLKEERLSQIEVYIDEVQGMQNSYGDAVNMFMTRSSNLYSIQLRPREQDHQSSVINPVFHLKRQNDNRGKPLSPLYNAMHRIFPVVAVAKPDSRTYLITAVEAALPIPARFADIQRILGEQCYKLFGLGIDFTKLSNGNTVDKAAINALMGFGRYPTAKEYIDALLGFCAPRMWEFIPTSPFYSISRELSVANRTEELSILTQFFLANLTVYCRAKRISPQNFGVLFDASSSLSSKLVYAVSSALEAGEDVEDCICTFFNIHADDFGLARSLNADDLISIKQKFVRTYHTVASKKENPHMDDFMILDREATGETAKFVTHQGDICVNFGEIVDMVAAASANPNYFEQIRKDFAIHPIDIPHKNEWVVGGIERAPEELLACLNEEQFKQLPQTVQDECRVHPAFQLRQFLPDIAKGKQGEAEALLNATPANAQILLRTPGVFTDYSGRTFNCTAYEYAYWAKDTHMCRMLERHMDEKTKAQILMRVNEMERIDPATGQPAGLEYRQNGKIHRSNHFDFTPLKRALQQYVDGNVIVKSNAWLPISTAQRDLPAHVVQEYCRLDRSFRPTPQFNEATLPRTLTFFDSVTGRDNSWFPLSASEFIYGAENAPVLMRNKKKKALKAEPFMHARTDLLAIISLDEVRTADLRQSRKNLSPLNSKTEQILSTPDLINLAMLSKNHWNLFKPMVGIRKLLCHVVRGEHDAVNAMLKKDINLIFKRDRVTDCSGRSFDNVSAFEYALWAMDKHMWALMLQCIPQDEEGRKILAILLAQYNKVNEEGVTYTLNGETITEHHFDFANTIIKELQIQANLMSVPEDDRDEELMNKQWPEGVGGAQRLLPMHVIHEYCSNEPFYPVPGFTKQPKSSKQFYNYATGKYENWFKPDSKLGTDFALFKGPRTSAWVQFKGGWDEEPDDLPAMKALHEVRKKDFINLKAQLKEQMTVDNQFSNRFNLAAR